MWGRTCLRRSVVPGNPEHPAEQGGAERTEQAAKTAPLYGVHAGSGSAQCLAHENDVDSSPSRGRVPLPAHIPSERDHPNRPVKEVPTSALTCACAVLR